MAKKPKWKATNTLVTFLLDRSGSMAAIKDDTIGAFNEYLKGLKTAKTKIEFTFLQFDSGGLSKLCVRQDVKLVPDLNDQSFQPRASTPLIDAAYKTIKAVEESLAKDVENTKVVVCIQTDGQENCSTQYTWEALNVLIKEKMAAGWQFNFMGAGIDAYQQASRMGLSSAQTISYDSHDTAATRAAYAGRAASTVLYASGAVDTMNIGLLEKQAAGDVFDPALKGMAQANNPWAATPGPTTSRQNQDKKKADPTIKMVDDLKL
jgi:hypothetical protein